jgi:hypothetical protein
MTETSRPLLPLLRRGAGWCAWRIHPQSWRAARRLRELRDRHRDQRCFILGNGPSLAEMDLAPLARELTFGMNRIYLLFERMGFEPTYYTCVNELLMQQCGGEIARLPMPKFLSWPGRRCVRDPRAIYIRSLPGEARRFSCAPQRSLSIGGTVTYFTMQVAWHLGFQQVILVGVDHRFSATGAPNAVVRSGGPDADHFSPDYFPAGFRWQLPDLAASERSYQLARRHFERAGRSILDATVGGGLTVFPKIDYRTLFTRN